MPFNEKGEIILRSQPKQLSPEDELEKIRLYEKSEQLLNQQDSVPDLQQLTDEEEKESACKRLLIRQSLLNQNPEKK